MSDQIKETTVFGVKGKIIGPRIGAAKRGSNQERIIKQTFTSEMRPIEGFGPGGQMQVTIRWDDECGNGHNSFAITASVWTRESRRQGDIAAGGCLHDDIAKVFPELAHLTKWHLVSSDGPMHYIGNTLYHAGDRDCWGRTKGQPSIYETWLYEPKAFIGHKVSDELERVLKAFETVNLRDQFRWLEVVEVPHAGGGERTYSPKYTFKGYPVSMWGLCPFDTQKRAQEWSSLLTNGTYKLRKVPVAWSEGKPRELENARRSAIWPDATDEQLCLPKEELIKLLDARLPALMAEFRAAVEAAGFMWEYPA